MVKRFRMRLSWWIRVITRVPNPTECTTPTANRNVNPGPWAIARRRCRFVSRDKRPTLRGMSIMEEAVCAWGAAGVGKSSAPPSRFCCAPKIPLLKNLFKMTIKKRGEGEVPGRLVAGGKKNVKHREIDTGAFYNRTKQNETSFHTRVHVFDLFIKHKLDSQAVYHYRHR